jgi:hypothetical protein
MKSFMELANYKPRLSKHDLDTIDRAHDQKKDGRVLGKVGLKEMAKMESWGVP